MPCAPFPLASPFSLASPFPLASLDAWSRNALTWWEMWFAAPQVIGMRVARMALAGAAPGARDRREFARMGPEKAEAVTEAMMAVGLRAWQAQQSVALTMMRQWARPQIWAPWAQAMPGLMAAGMKPVHRRVTANARRLSGRRRR